MGPNDHLKGGVRFDRPPDLAFPPLAFAAAGSTLPADFPRRGFLTIGGPQKQKRAGSCLPHAYSAAVEAYFADLGADLQVSIMDWYFGGRWIEGNGAENVDGGTYPSKGRAWAEQYGLLTAARAPYVDSQVTLYRPDPRWAADRALMRAGFDPIPVTLDTILYALGVERKTVAICHRATAGIDRVGADGIERYIPNGESWGHCRLGCAWDLDKVFPDGTGGIGILNWWGDPEHGFPWGIAHPENAAHRDGFSWMSFASLLTPGFVDDVGRLVRPPAGVLP